MPYLRLSKNSSGDFKAKFAVENCGNGSAFEVYPKTKEDLVIHEGKRLKGKPSMDLIRHGKMDDSVIPVGKTGFFEVSAWCCDADGREIDKPELSFAGEAAIILCFKDSFSNDYEQVFEMVVDASLINVEIKRQGFPKLVTK